MTDPALLVFGAGGQVGEEVRRLATRVGIPLQAVPRAALDITDAAAARAALRAMADAAATEGRVAVAINAAAHTKVDRAESEPEAAWAVNAHAPGHLAAACQAVGMPLLHLSTDYVFDGTSRTPYRESDPVAPLGVYGLSKEAGEQAVRAALDHHVIVRTSWVFAAHGHNFLRTMLRLGEDRPTLRVVADQRGTPTAAADIAAALLQIARRVAVQARSGAEDGRIWGTYHFTNAGETTWHGFATAIFAERQRLTGRPAPVVEAITTADYPTPARRPAYSCLDCQRIGAVFDVRPRPWTDALASVMAELSAGSHPTGSTP